MFERSTPKIDRFQEAIDTLLVTMSGEAYDSDDYEKMMNHLARLCKLKEQTAQKRVTPDTWLIVGGNILGIVLILGYERAHVISSKALGFVMRLR